MLLLASSYEWTSEIYNGTEHSTNMLVNERQKNGKKISIMIMIRIKYILSFS